MPPDGPNVAIFMAAETYGVLEAFIREESAELWDLWCIEWGAVGSEWAEPAPGKPPTWSHADPQPLTVRSLPAAGALPPGLVRVRHFFEAPPAGSLQACLAGFRARFPDLVPPASVAWSEKPVEGWATQWQQHFTPLPVGERLLICPPWDSDPADAGLAGRLRLVIDPGQGFGTGRHASTALALRLVEHVLGDRAWIPERILDVGTGSGILLIAARLLGARAGSACDIDAAVESEVRRNLQLSGLDPRVDFHLGPPAELQGSFPLVLANITAPALIRMASDLRRLTSPGGHLILSGMLSAEVEPVLAEFAAPEWALGSRAEAEGWVAVELARRAS